ncbi:lipid II:glycine glycyltransferase (peptidoglycan interpeptide bridge formation enzyme) [Couchioplanes caeruleus]|nr:lipid II:glycine glycyltransferase (peptidoglycan interpeptide bridge formation enzyme) [Couchioplanes caeruleus]
MSLDVSWPWHSVLPGASWDQQLSDRDGHFLQSTHWAAFQQSMGREVFFGEGPGWQCMAILERAGENARLYAPYGPVAEGPEAFTAAVSALRALGEKHSVLFIRSEPWAPVGRDDVAALGFFPARNLQPGLTWVQDLRKTRDELFSEFSANNRNRFRNAHKKGLSITSSTDVADVEILLDMIHDVSNNTGMQPHEDDYYRRQAKALLDRDAATLYVARHHDKPVAAAIVYDSATTRYYAHSGSLLEARNLHPGGPMLATMVLDAQARGQAVFDFMGAAPADQPDHPWAGFTQFKQSFGGRYRAYLGTWEMPITDKNRFAAQSNSATSGKAVG